MFFIYSLSIKPILQHNHIGPVKPTHNGSVSPTRGGARYSPTHTSANRRFSPQRNHSPHAGNNSNNNKIKPN